MSNKHIEITVKGLTHSGKTLISWLIQKHLEELGATVTVNDQDGPATYKRTSADLSDRMVNRRYEIENVLENIGVTINQESVLKPMSDTSSETE